MFDGRHDEPSLMSLERKLNKTKNFLMKRRRGQRSMLHRIAQTSREPPQGEREKVYPKENSERKLFSVFIQDSAGSSQTQSLGIVKSEISRTENTITRRIHIVKSSNGQELLLFRAPLLFTFINYSLNPFHSFNSPAPGLVCLFHPHSSCFFLSLIPQP
jgi:hypothetical protein